MRISDWSSDVCSSDLRPQLRDRIHVERVVALHLHLRSQRLQVLYEVEGEAVVVVDHQQHAGLPATLPPPAAADERPSYPFLPSPGSWQAGFLGSTLAPPSATVTPPSPTPRSPSQIGSTAGRERVCQYLYISV